MFLHSCSCFTVKAPLLLFLEAQRNPAADTPLHTYTHKHPECINPPVTDTFKSLLIWYSHLLRVILWTVSLESFLHSYAFIQSAVYNKALRFGPPIRQLNWLVANKLLPMVWTDFNFWLCRGGGVSLVQKPHSLGFASLHWYIIEAVYFNFPIASAKLLLCVVTQQSA